MKDLVNKIAIESGARWQEGYVESNNGDHVWSEKAFVDHSEMDLSKFADMIVAECTSVCKSTKNEYLAYQKAALDFDEKNNFAEGSAVCDQISAKIKQKFK